MTAAPLAATTITFTGSITSQSLDWTDTVSVQGFDPTLGTLNSVTIRLTNNMATEFQLESTNAGPATVTVNISADVRLLRPDTTVLVSSVSVASGSQSLSGFDGLFDFGGTSGITDSTTASNSETSVFTAPADLALFISNGLLSLDAEANGDSSFSGASNLFGGATTEAGAGVEITYNYTSPSEVPEPSTMLLLGVGGVALGLFRRR